LWLPWPVLVELTELDEAVDAAVASLLCGATTQPGAGMLLLAVADGCGAPLDELAAAVIAALTDPPGQEVTGRAGRTAAAGGTADRAGTGLGSKSRISPRRPRLGFYAPASCPGKAPGSQGGRTMGVILGVLLFIGLVSRAGAADPVLPGVSLLVVVVVAGAALALVAPKTTGLTAVAGAAGSLLAAAICLFRPAGQAAVLNVVTAVAFLAVTALAGWRLDRRVRGVRPGAHLFRRTRTPAPPFHLLEVPDYWYRPERPPTTDVIETYMPWMIREVDAGEFERLADAVLFGVPKGDPQLSAAVAALTSELLNRTPWGGDERVGDAVLDGVWTGVTCADLE
jgi:hypothetical protein